MPSLLAKSIVHVRVHPVLCSMDFDKCIVTRIYHGIITQNSFTALKILCALPFIPPSPPLKPLATTNFCFAMQCSVAKSYPTLWDPREYTCQAPQSMGFSRQENWSGLPFPSPEDLPDPGIELMTPALADSLPLSLLRSQFFTVTIILPFPECHVIGISKCVASSDRLISLCI